MPVDITRLTEGWLELESDPGLFMLLLDDFGVKNVQVEEIYDITKPFDGPVYGFIFLFRWIEERRSRRKIFDQSDMFLKEEGVVNNIFFAQQMVPNSCATHALLSVLLNCPKINLGETLARLKADTVGMTPENKGWAIGNTPELARAHNSHAMPQAKRCVEKNSASASVTSGRYAGEAFHFVSYVPIQDRLFELDGLKPYPIDHGPCDTDEDWTEKFRKVMTERLGAAGDEPCHDIRFNLMALIPDRRIALSHKLNMLKTNQEIVVTALQQLVHINNESKKCNYKDEEKDIKESSDLCSNSSLTESEAALINDLKFDKVEQEDLEDKADSNNAFKTDSIVQLEENNAMQLNSPNDLHFANVTNDLTSDSKENVAEFNLDHKHNLCVNSEDYSMPLSIKTSPNPSISGTDTSSDMGSGFSSPLALGWSWNTCQTSACTKDFKKYVVLHVEDGKSESPSGCTIDLMPVDGLPSQSQSNGLKLDDFDADKPSSPAPSEHQNEKSIDCSPEDGDAKTTLMLKYPVLKEPHTFAPKDLLALLKNVESEISNCEINLRDENDKRSKYKIDDCRRTQSYDEFLCTFFSMMANQGKLADVVEQEVHKRPGIPAHRLKKILIIKKSDNKSIAKKRKGKTKHRRRNKRAEECKSKNETIVTHGKNHDHILKAGKSKTVSNSANTEKEDSGSGTIQLLRNVPVTDLSEKYVEIKQKKKKKPDVTPEEIERQNRREQLSELRNKLKISVSGKNVPPPVIKFEELPCKYNVSTIIIDNLFKYGFTCPTPIQMQAIPPMLEGRNIMACAPTGSGKTIAFLIPVLYRLKKPMDKGYRAVIVCPTRELARQIYRESVRISEGTGIRINIISKINQKIEQFDLKKSAKSSKQFDVLITTPNRLVFLLNQDPPRIDLQNVEWLIIDESDKLFETGVRGFRNQLAVIYNACNSANIKRAMFSATQTPVLTKWCRKNLKNLILVNIGIRNTAVSSVHQELLFVGNEQGKLLAIRDLIRKGVTPPVLVFVQTKERAQELFNELVYDGINVDVIHSDRSQQQRDNVIRGFREGKIWVLICTELMGRGIDFKGVSLVVNYDFPPTTVSYIHRIGRTGRAGRPGKAITYFTHDDKTNLRNIAYILKESGCSVPDFMLKLKKSNKRDLKKLAVRAPKRHSISTTPLYQRIYERKERMKMKRAKLEQAESANEDKESEVEMAE